MREHIRHIMHTEEMYVDRIEEAAGVSQKVDPQRETVAVGNQKYVVSEITRVEDTDAGVRIWFDTSFAPYTDKDETESVREFQYPIRWDRDNPLVRIAEERDIDSYQLEQLIGEPLYVQYQKDGWYYTPTLKKKHNPKYMSLNDANKIGIMAILSIMFVFSIAAAFVSLWLTMSVVIAVSGVAQILKHT